LGNCLLLAHGVLRGDPLLLDRQLESGPEIYVLN
jgi:hypothetical protein